MTAMQLGNLVRVRCLHSSQEARWYARFPPPTHNPRYDTLVSLPWGLQVSRVTELADRRLSGTLALAAISLHDVEAKLPADEPRPGDAAGPQLRSGHLL